MQPRSLPPSHTPTTGQPPRCAPLRFRTLGCLAALVLMVGCAQGAPLLTFRWSPEVSRAEPYDAEAFHGETFTLAATPLQYGRPLTGLTDAGAKLYWQTPGMEPTQWYTAPGAYDPATGTLTATWTPAMDVGGDRVTFFFALTQGDAVAYRVYGRLRLAASPGFNPAELVPEDVRQELIDAITADVKGWADATYQPKGDYLTAEADPTVPAWAKADAKPAYDWTEILNRPATFPPATHNHDAAYLRLNQNRAGTTNQLSGAILTMHRRDDKQYPIFMLGSQVSNGLMKSDRWVASLYYDRIEFLSDAGTEPRVLAFGADTADSIVRKAELDEAMDAKADASALQNYLPLTGGTVTGETTIMGTRFSNNGWLFASNISEGGTWIANKYAAKAHTHTQGDVEGLTAALAAKQDTLTAGEGISIEGNVISATGGDPAELPIDTAWPDAPADDRVPSTQLLDEELTARLAKKQNTIGASTQLSLMNLTASGTVAAKTLTQGGTALDDLYYSKTSGQATQTLAQQAQTNAAKAISDAASAKNAASAADTKAGTALTSAQAAQTTAEAAMPKSGGTFTGGLNVMGTVTAAALAEGGQALADKYAAKGDVPHSWQDLGDLWVTQSLTTDYALTSLVFSSPNINFGVKRDRSAATLELSNGDFSESFKVELPSKAYVDEAIAAGGGGSYSLPMASASTLGGVKVDGSMMRINEDGTILPSVCVDYNWVPYVLIGEGLSFDLESKTLKASGGSYTLPKASASTLGGVKVGNGLTIAGDGTLSATPSAPQVAERGGLAMLDGSEMLGTGLGLAKKPLTSGDTLSPTTVTAGVEIVGEAANHLSVTPWDNGEIHMLRFEHKAAYGYDYTSYFTFVGDRRMEADGIYHLRCYSFGGKVYAEVIHREGE